MINKIKKTLLSSVIAIAVVACATNSETKSIVKKSEVELGQAMVVTANPLASKVGAEILIKGGSAVDAAIAIEAVLSLVEPQSSGLAGGGFLVYYDNKTKQVTSYNGRETAPASATVDMFIDGEKKMGFLNAKHSGLSTGVPGVVAMLALAHQDHGSLEWGVHFDRAKQLASDGFAVSPRLHGMISRFGKYLPKTPDEGPTEAYQYFHNQDGSPLAVGHILKNPAYAKALDSIAKNPKNFYRGEVADAILKQVSLSPRAGAMTKQDLLNYKAKRQIAVCLDYKETSLCGPPPPSSWIAVGMIMGILEKSTGFSDKGVADIDNWRLFTEAQRLAYADRDRYVADPNTVMVPMRGLSNQDYLAKRASQIDPKNAGQAVSPGDPWAFDNPLSKVEVGVDHTNDKAGTTHFVVVDNQGNVVSMTASVESIFGSGRMAAGMFLNNQLTDFSFIAKDDSGKLVANSVAANKQPRSSMSPTIVLDKSGDFKMATGSPGGNSIIAYTAKTLVGVLDWGLTPQAAVNLPNLVARGSKVRVEKDRALEGLIEGLESYGFNVKKSKGENSGLSVVLKHSDGRLEGGVDPRREGIIVTVESSEISQ